MTEQYKYMKKGEDKILVDAAYLAQKDLSGNVITSTYATKDELNGKQDTIAGAQLDALNSGITSGKVTTYEGYASQIAGKQAQLDTDQLAAVNSGITQTKVGTYEAYATGKVNVLDIVDNLTSTATNQPLSANQGKVLDERISNISTVGRYLAGWNCTTGKPTTDPTSLPYAYKTGDYYIISNVGASNYRPNGSSYTGVASTTTETETVVVGGVYRFDGTSWTYSGTVEKSVPFASLAGLPTDNDALATALGQKAAVTALTDGSVTKVGTADVGGAKKPVYLAGGVPTACDYTLGDVSTLAKITSTDTTTASDLNVYTALKTDALLSGKQSTLTFDESPTADSNNPVKSKGILTALNGKVPTTRKVAGHALTDDVTISKSDVGLGNCDNTSDANKPVSTATQTALNGKQATITGAASTITATDLTPSCALVSDASGKVAVSDVTSTELGYLDGVTSAIQTQLDNKLAKKTITAATKCKITYDANGLVTAGADLEATDIPSLGMSKITTMTGYTKPSTAYTAIAATDTANTAIGKLEKRCDELAALDPGLSFSDVSL